MNPRLRSLLLAGSGFARWSQLYAGAGAGDDIVVSQPVLFDLPASPIYGNVYVTSTGALDVSTSINTHLQFNSMEVDGQDLIGRSGAKLPIGRVHKRTGHGPRSAEVAGNLSSPSTAVMTKNRGIVYNPGSTRKWFGETPAIVNVKLAATAIAGATSGTLSQAVTWKAGKTVYFARTRYWKEEDGLGWEYRTLAADVNNSTTFTWTVPLTYTHYGSLQYLVPIAQEQVAGTSLSVIPHTILAGDAFHGGRTGTQILANNAKRIRDNRCTISYCDHPIQLESVNDIDYQQHGFGFTVGTMGFDETVRMVEGVQYRRGGKAGMKGAYPEHDHLRCIIPTGEVGSGTVLGVLDYEENYQRKCSFIDSTNRGFVFHGTQGTELADCFFDNIDTHCVIQEDGSEANIRILRNHVANVNPINTVHFAAAAAAGVTPEAKVVIQAFDTDNQIVQIGSNNRKLGPTGFWLAHLGIHFEGNEASGGKVGIWNIPSSSCFGKSVDCDIQPNREPIGTWKDNEAHGQSSFPMVTGGEIINDAGQFGTTNGHPSGNSWRFPLTENLSEVDEAEMLLSKMEGANLWKGHHGIYANNAVPVNYDSFVLGAMRSPYTVGAGGGEDYDEIEMVTGLAGGRFIRCLFNPKTLDDFYPTHKPYVAVTYHGGVWFQDCNMCATPVTGLAYYAHGKLVQKGGAMRLNDFYEETIHTMLRKYTGTNFICENGNYPGWMMPPLYMLSRWPSAYAAATAVVGSDFTTFFSAAVGVGWPQAQVGAMRTPADGAFGELAGWRIFDDPFYTYGLTPLGDMPVPPGLAAGDGGVVVDGALEWYGLGYITMDGLDIGGSATGGGNAVTFSRLDPADDSVEGTWEFPSTTHNLGMPFIGKRNCSVLQGGYYDIHWPTVSNPTTGYKIEITADSDQVCVAASAHYFYLRVAWAGSDTITGMTCGGVAAGAPLASKAAVLAQTAFKYWQDTANNKVYVCVSFGQQTRVESQGLDHLLANHSKLNFVIS